MQNVVCGSCDQVEVQGFAYVEFETKEGLQHAVDMTGIELNGKHLKISVATPPGGGGGRGRGRGRGEP